MSAAARAAEVCEAIRGGDRRALARTITLLESSRDDHAAEGQAILESLVPYTGSDAGEITVNGELNKIANNVSFGHGIHAGIHWRSDTSSSIQLGEAVTIGMLQDRAATYAEKFTISFKKIDGSIATISLK